MITTKRDDPWVMLSVGGNRDKRAACQRVITNWGKRPPMEEFLVAGLDLLDSELIVVGCNGDITAVDELEAGQERVDFEGDVVTAIQS